MTHQSKRAFVVDGEPVVGMKVPCGTCGGLSRYENVTCERRCTNGFVLWPLRHMVERAFRKTVVE